MQYNILLTDEAIINIKKASLYYLEISSSLNDSFISDLQETIERLQLYPLHHQLRYRKIRIAHTTKFPFGIHFIIEGNIIRVLNILHHKQFYK